ncbi:hypothetical protein ACFHYQ_26385 [Sphaerimonospora cavernae]|uniref:AMP-binding enzyme C-terminal domain-containing protein n=1 Tax=Sphaerimonospora cavernae TaxID=1740611 RepID=A0ABV6UCC9_9ACTN
MVVVAPGAMVTEDELREHMLAGIARYKVPTLPRNATGKINRAQVELATAPTHRG